MTELRALLDESADQWGRPSLIVETLGLLDNPDSQRPRRVSIGECNRSTPVAMLRIFYRSMKVVARERPRVILTTGSLPLAIFSLVAWCFGSRIIWIDSISQIDGLSMSGRLVRPFATLFLVQWPELADPSRGLEYAGELV